MTARHTGSGDGLARAPRPDRLEPGRASLRSTVLAHPMRTTGVVLGAAAIAVSSVALLAASPAGAEASRTTATLTLTGVLDSNCKTSTGGTTVYVAPGGTVTFKAALAGIYVDVPVLGSIPITSSKISSFDDKLVIDGKRADPHMVNGSKKFVLNGVTRGRHRIAWSATSVHVLPIPLLLPRGKKVYLKGNVSGLPAGAKLNWVGTLNATSSTAKCGISAQLPGVKASAGPVHVKLPPVNLPTVSNPIGKLTSALPTGVLGGGTHKTHKTHKAKKPTHPKSAGVTYTPAGEMIPERVVTNVGGGGNSAFGPDVNGNGYPLADSGGGNAVAPDGSRSSTAAGARPDGSGTSLNSSNGSHTVDLAKNRDASGSGVSAMPVLLAVLAIIVLSLVCAGTARLYLVRKHAA